MFDPAYPGAYPFRLSRGEDAFVLLGALRPFARAGDAILNVVVEGQPEIAEALLAGGATLRIETVHMRGPIA